MKLTQEQLAELIAKVFANIDAKRKACKEDGEISTDEIIAEVSAILEEMGDGETDPGEDEADPVEGEKAEDGTGEGNAVNPEFIAQVIAALGGMKSGDGAEEIKTAETGREVKSGGPASTGTGRANMQAFSYREALPAIRERRAALRPAWNPCLPLKGAGLHTVCSVVP